MRTNMCLFFLESDECFDTNGIRCVGCWGRKGKCNDFSYDRCSFSEYLGFKWCPGIIIFNTLF